MTEHPSNKVTLENLKEVVYWHKPSEDQVKRMEGIAQHCETLMMRILYHVPDCADRTVALRCIREARMWANSAIVLGTDVPIDHERGL
jgi:hypothetical protein